MAVRPNIEATDRSMPRVMMIMPCASATIAKIEMSSRMSLKLVNVRKFGLRRLMSAINNKMKPINASSRKRAKSETRLGLDFSSGLVVTLFLQKIHVIARRSQADEAISFSRTLRLLRRSPALRRTQCGASVAVRNDKSLLHRLRRRRHDFFLRRFCAIEQTRYMPFVHHQNPIAHA